MLELSGQWQVVGSTVMNKESEKVAKDQSGRPMYAMIKILCLVIRLLGASILLRTWLIDSSCLLLESLKPTSDFPPGLWSSLLRENLIILIQIAVVFLSFSQPGYDGMCRSVHFSPVSVK